MSLPLAMAAANAAAAITTTICALVLWRRRTLVGARSLASASAAVAVWSALYTAELLSADYGAALTFGALKYIGVCLLPPAWLVFALQYTGRSHLINGWLFAFLAAHPMIMLLLLANTGTAELLRVPVGFTSGVPVVDEGPLFYLHMAYVTAILAIGTAVIGRTLIAVSRRYLRQSLVLAGAALVPWMANLAFNLPELQLLWDPTPVALAVVEVAYLWGVLRFPLFNVAPIGRSTVLDTLDDAIIVVDLHGRIVDLNRQAAALLAAHRREALGTPLTTFLPDHPDLLERGTEADHARREIVLARGDTVVDYEVTVSALARRGSTMPGHVVVLRDVTDRQRTQRRMERLVNYDQLTDLPNRQLFSARLEGAVSSARRTGRQVGVLFIDLDGFKTVNDTLGHDVGDLILRETANRMLDSIRESDTAARLGGDEFMLVVPDVSGHEGAAAVALKLLGAISEPFTASGRRVHISASIGIAVAPPDPLERVALSRLADTAMYEAKAQGKNRYAFAVTDDLAHPDDVGAGARTGSGGSGGQEARAHPSPPSLTVVRASDRPARVVVEDPQSSHRSRS